GNDAFQEADTCGITRAVTKHNSMVRNVDDIPRVIAEAFHIASTGKPGPVLVDIPKDMQQATTDAITPSLMDIRGYKDTFTSDDKEVDALAEAINSSEKPLLYVGGGVIASGAAAELTALARKARIPVTTTLLGLGGFPETDPLSVRMLGMHGSVMANRSVSHCDLLISVGARFDDRVTGRMDLFAPKAKIAHIDIDPCAIGKSVAVDLPVSGDAKDILIKLLDRVEEIERTPWLEQVAEWTQQFPFAYDKNDPELLPQFVIEKIYEVTGGDAIITTEVGQHQMWAAHFFKYTKPRTFLSSGGLGTMGYGLPAAIGAQAGCRDKIVVDIAGDGSTQMNFQELVVAVENDLPINIVILNNGYLGMVRQWQEMFYNGEYSATHLMPGRLATREKIPQSDYLPDFVKMAEAHGAKGVRISEKGEVTGALEDAFAHKGPVVIECIVKPEENLYPMVPPGAGLMEMIQSMA
ncbi:MAG: biosynthetic-type acetolactate synthase large subunit, partial [Kiritimatiellae bacterium]|nr:biosynthetic-type acetolactate synthase large subunit [Kiritimatiellia bacterium]